MVKKIGIPLLIVIILGGGVWWYFNNNKSDVVTWRTAKVEQGDIKVVVTATGTINPDTTVQVGTQVSGIIAKILTDFNKQVKRNQLVAVLDTTPLLQAVIDAKAAVSKAKANKDLAKANLDREQSLFNQKLVAQSELDASVASYESAMADALSAQAQLDKANTNLSYAYIKSPIEGVVVSRNVEVGQTVAASFSTPTLFSIANTLTKMQIWASVDEADIGSVHDGQSVDFTVDAYPNQTFKGSVSQIRLQPTTNANVVDYTVIVDVPNSDLKLLPGMTANLSINIDEHDSVLKVPTSALRFTPPRDYLTKFMANLPDSIKEKMQARRKQGGGQAGGAPGGGFGGGQNSGQAGGKEHDLAPGSFARLWVKQGDSLKPVRVEIGLSDGSFTEVKGDLQAGADIVMGVIAGDAAGAAQPQATPFSMRRF
ncbi:MAG TPA: efflux RND transporter periplasmic adaptor subunit [Candidatus Kapabacteria bacterium]|nr:efflux RND transporter periplasmic adaptor subunit [Candidatus Kapabacteria bacterium]